MIADKDEGVRRWNEGPYGRHIVLIHTDEPAFDEDVLAVSASSQPIRVRAVDDVYLMMSYMPDARDTYPQGRPVARIPTVKSA